MKIQVVTPKGVAFQEELEYIVVYEKRDEYSILKDHIPMITAFSNGYLKLVSKESVYLLLTGATIEFKNNELSVLCINYFKGSSKDECDKQYQVYKDELIIKNKKNKVDFTKVEKDLTNNIKKMKASKI